MPTTAARCGGWFWTARPSATSTTPRRRILTRVIEHLRKRHIRFAVSAVLGPVRKQLDRYGISAALGPGAYYDTPGEALEAFHAAQGVIGE